MLDRVISGFQTGADLAGIITARKFGIPTGGWMPKHYKTLDGYKPVYRLFGAMEHRSMAYPPRTFANIKESDGTMRFAANWKSPGEICTLKGILQYGRPYFDVDLINLDPESLKNALIWIDQNNIKVLNIAGNAEQTHPGCEEKVKAYLTKLFLKLGYKES